MGIAWVGGRRGRLAAAEAVAGWLRRGVLWIEHRDAPEVMEAEPAERASHAATESTGDLHHEHRAEASAEPGGPGDFEAFFHEHERRIFGYLIRLSGDEQTAHDLTQETFLRAWLHYARIAQYDAPAAWLFRVATNLAVSHQRRRGSPVGSAQLLGDDSGPVRSDPTRHSVERDAIQQTLLELSQNQRAALVLREVYGLSCEEIGRALGISRAAAKVTLFRARERFRARYGNAEGQAP